MAEDKDIKISSCGIRDEWKLWCSNQGCQYHLGTLQTQWRSLGIEPPKQVRVDGGPPKKCYSINILHLQRKLQHYLRDKDWEFDFGDVVEQLPEIDHGFINKPFIVMDETDS